MYADALSKRVIFKAHVKDAAGEKGKINGKQRDKEGEDETLNRLRKLKTHEMLSFSFAKECYRAGESCQK